jgi:sugar-specific transcriptional regulator TrmB
MDSKILKIYLYELGFSTEEAEIYEYLLQIGGGTILQISKNTRIERTKLYTITNEMTSKGYLELLFSNKQKILKVCPLERIKKLLQEKEEKTKFLVKNFSAFSSEYSEFVSSLNPNEIKVYSGKEGIRQILWNQLEEKEILSFGYRNCIEIVGYDFFVDWAKEYELRGITLREIRSDEFIESNQTPKYYDLARDYIRYIPSKTLDINTGFDMYNDCIAITSWNHGEAFGLELRNARFSKMMKQMFEIIWKISDRNYVDIDPLHKTKEAIKYKELHRG